MPYSPTRRPDKPRDQRHPKDVVRRKNEVLQRKERGWTADPLGLARGANSQEPPPVEDHRRSLARYAQPGCGAQRHGLLASLQQSFGNRYVQGLLNAPAVSASAHAGGAQAAIPAGGGRPLDEPLRADMEQRFDTSLGDVRLHTDAASGEASRMLGARAFTTGRDIYFGHGEYRPEAAQGRRLLAHELAHTIQQRGLAAGEQKALEVAAPDDPAEQRAERVADAVVRGNRAGPIAPLEGTAGPAARARMVQRQPAGTPSTGPAPGAAEGSDFVIGLGNLKIKQEELARAKSKGRYCQDLAAMSLPGLKLKNLELTLDRSSGEVKKGELAAALDIPFVKPLGRKDARILVDKDGKASFAAKAKLDVSALNNPEIELGLKEGDIRAAATLAAEKLKFSGLPKLKIPRANVTVGVAQGKVHGSGQVALEYEGLATGEFGVEFKEGAPAGKGRVELTPPYLKGVEAGLQIAEGKLAGEVSIPASKLSPPVPGLKVTEGTLSVGMQDGKLSGKGEGVVFAYQGLGKGNLSFALARDHLEGRGALELQIPGLLPVKGSLRYVGGRLSGAATITADKFSKGLPVKGGSITVGVDGDGSVSGKGSVGVNLFGVGRGDLKLGYEKGVLDLGAEVELTKIPGLETGRVLIGLKDGTLEGEGEVGIAPKQIPGLTGDLLVAYREDRFSGKAKIGYAKDKFAGEVELLLNQDEKGKLAVSGSGEVTARLTDWLTGKVHIDVLPDATTKIAGQLKADDVELFPVKKADRELFSISQNIPLWAILVAVIRIRGGVRAGVGPGMLRGVTAEGEFSTGEGDEPSFRVTGELFIPAYAEAYVAFGAGLGLDVVIGSLTGGIEAVGTAGIYGAVSVIPEIAYESGNFAISGVATLAAGAKLKLGLQAWAEVEAFWITVWSNTWRLAEWVWDVGPELALQAQMKYVFGRPEPPTFEFKTSDIDASRLIQDAMPKEGPKGSGAREALQNRAEWKGKLKEQRKDPSKIPAELAQKQQKAPQPKALPPKPTKSQPPADLKVKDPVKAKELALKELKQKAAPAKSKEMDKALQEKWQKGMAALEQLRQKAQSDPEDSEEIKNHLMQIKGKYGFRELSYSAEGDHWVVSAAMSPAKKVSVPMDPLEQLRKEIEGKTGTYSGLRAIGKTGDRITPDHEPQDALMSYVRNDVKFKGKRLFENTSIDNYSHSQGISLNMEASRHYQTRTYGGGGSASKAQAASAITSKLANLPAKATEKDARKEVGKIVEGELKEDHKVVKDIYNNATGLDPVVKNRALAGIGQVKSLNRANYFKAFKE
ncbi:MAG: DUF4157 domain-containing protein [Desulfobacterales bacterium]|nr:MAG: DUF4157 domain-containing protein [Desulfobacterales bacterium]